MSQHEAVCEHKVIDLMPLGGVHIPQPVVQEPSVPRTRDLVRHGARFGASMGKARGPSGAAAGGLLGGVLGFVAGHVLNLPDVRPVVDAIQGLREPVQDVVEIARGVVVKKP